MAVEVNERWGYMNNKGKFVIAPRFRAAESFLDGVARVSTDKKWGYINKRGYFVWHTKGPYPTIE